MITDPKQYSEKKSFPGGISSYVPRHFNNSEATAKKLIEDKINTIKE